MSLQAADLISMSLMAQLAGGVEQFGTGKVGDVSVQLASALKEDVKLFPTLLAFKRTPVNVWLTAVVVEPTATELTVFEECNATPLRTRLPVAGLFVKLTVTFAV